MRLALIFEKTRPDTLGIYLERAARALGLEADFWPLHEAARIPSGYDLYLRVDHGDDYLTWLPDRLRPSVFYAVDTHLAHSAWKIRRAARRYDLVVCCHRDGAARLRGAEWLPVACDPELHTGRDDARVWDVAFVGYDGGVPRKIYLQALRERYPQHFIGTAEHTQLGRIYGRARIGFNYSIRQDVNMRVFEVLASGCLLVTNAPRPGDLGPLGLREGEHYVAYRAPGEVFPLMDRFLEREEERAAISRAGKVVALTRHTYVHRVRELLGIAARRLGVTLPQYPEGWSACVSS